MNRFIVILGSNMGNPVANLKQALGELAAFTNIVEVSPCFETPPLLPPGAPTEWYRFFANAAATVETDLSAEDLLTRTQALEQRLGRSAVHERWSPRALDIDLLFENPHREYQSPTLRLPHPEWSKRGFVLAPLTHLTPPENLPGELFSIARQNRQRPTALMGAINVTPDSFSQTQNRIDYDELIARFQKMLELNVAFVDLGGESTRPGGATPVSPSEEWSRLEPLLDFWKSVRAENPFTKLSLDTYHPETARRALDYKVEVLNDVSHLSNPAMRELAPHFDSVVLMHSLSVPADKNKTWREHADVIEELKTWFSEVMETSGLPTHKVIFDPGLGFGKTALQSMQILQRVDELADLPVRRLIGHSRKSFMAHFSTTPAFDRDLETLGASVMLAERGIEILRVHNVEWHQRALRAASAVVAP